MAAKVEIPFLDISVEALEGLETKSEKWRELCDRVREACETHGIFFLVYDKIPTSLREEIFVALKTLFDLPEETKNKHVNPRPYRSYLAVVVLLTSKTCLIVMAKDPRSPSREIEL
ncbi:hypothetical protein OIU84_000266 [Salix udensis]|uniref:Non-haem dioxygenase N-terminal domain-containing protein n=1 Tax=Salix udensis TaxID=889485 RepID=A0AAD6L4F4_9ROSI|nr:hypothetical protein OIU84_000266 [Salix udensis]